MGAVDTDWTKRVEWQANQFADLQGGAAILPAEVERLRAEGLAERANHQSEVARMHEEIVEAQRRHNEIARQLADSRERVQVLNVELSSARAATNEEQRQRATIRD